MAWIDDESRWESGETGFGVGRTLYWLTTTIAAIIVVFAVADFLYQPGARRTDCQGFCLHGGGAGVADWPRLPALLS